MESTNDKFHEARFNRLILLTTFKKTTNPPPRWILIESSLFSKPFLHVSVHHAPDVIARRVLNSPHLDRLRRAPAVMAHPADYPRHATGLLDGEKDLRTELSLTQDTLVSYTAKLKKIIRLLLSSILLRPEQAGRLWMRFGYALTPQLLRTLIWKDHAPLRKQFPTSYLNGLRGCTALKVFTFHYIHALSDIAFQPWGTNERHRYILEFPIIRYFYSGFTSHIFFGVAGYLTSVRLLQLMDAPDPLSQAQVLASISASLFRRVFRLYLPVFIITLMTATWIYLGLYEHNRPYLLDHQKYFPGEWNEPKPLQYSTYCEQLKFWSSEMFDLTNIIWEETFYPVHDQHLWSILSEMRASLHLYLCLLMLAQCTGRVRLVFFSILIVLYFYWNHWDIWVYILGALVAQIDIILTEAQQRNKSPLLSSFQEKLEPMELEQSIRPSLSNTTYQLPRQVSNHITLPSLRFFGFLLAFYFLSYPIDGSRDYAPGYMTLNLAIPDWMTRKDKFYPNIGTAILLLLLVRSDPKTSKWRKLLTSKIPQYMGSISFGFYLVHGPIMHLFGFMIPQWVWWGWLGLEGGNNTTDFQWITGVLCGWVPTLVVSLWAADVWTREVEERCVRFVKVLEGWCFHRKEQ
jgi:peptidoglycan/LPS O-acetylase OafA/YrhL